MALSALDLLQSCTTPPTGPRDPEAGPTEQQDHGGGVDTAVLARAASGLTAWGRPTGDEEEQGRETGRVPKLLRSLSVRDAAEAPDGPGDPSGNQQLLFEPETLDRLALNTGARAKGEGVQVIVVANRDQESVGRQLVHAISMVEGTPAPSAPTDAAKVTRPHSAVLWSEQRYLSSEADLWGNRVAVVFVGPSRPALDLLPVLPQRFAGFGVRCHLEGRRAVLIADTPPESGADRRQLARDLGIPTPFADELQEAVAAADGGPGPYRTVMRLKDPIRLETEQLQEKIPLAQYRYAASRFLAEGLPMLEGG